MNADCLAIIDNENNTLWVRAATFSLEGAAQALAELRKVTATGNPRLIKSFVDADGCEQYVEILTPWADSYLRALEENRTAPDKALVEIWIDNHPKFGMGGIADKLQPALFKKVAALLVGHIKGDDESALESSFMATQNAACEWSPGEGIRSSSVGDVFVLNSPSGRTAYVVSSIGFKKVSFSEIAHGDTSNVLSLSKYRAEAYLKRLGLDKKVSELYDDDETFQGALLTLIPVFEYPNWSHRTVEEVLNHVFSCEKETPVSTSNVKVQEGT
jgi:hypothetical protein